MSGSGSWRASIACAKLAVEIPAVGRVDLVLELAHLGHESVEVGIGLGHLLADLVEAVDLGEQVAEGHATFSMTVLSSSSGGSCCRMPTV